MKKLNKFLKFDLVAFVKGKTFEVVEVKPHFVYENGEKKESDGVTIKVAITSDSTDYGDADVTNKFEQFGIKCIGADLIQAREKFHIGDVVELIKYKKATVYGKFRNELSVEIGNLNHLVVKGNDK